MHKFILIMMIIILPNSILGQKLNVIVQDSANNQKVIGAIVLLELPSKTLSAITDTMGLAKFSFIDKKEISGIIRVSSIGYKQKILTINLVQSSDIMIVLQPDNVELEGVIVKANKPFIEPRAGRLLINIASSPLASVGNVWNSLRYTPLVSTSQSGNISILSQGASIFIDDKQLFLSGDDLKIYLESVSADAIDQIEVITNPSSKYGSSMGKVLHIHTKKTREYGYQGTINSEIGRRTYFPFASTNISMDWKQPKYIVQTRYNYSTRKIKSIENIETNSTYEDISDNSRFSHFLSLNYTYYLSKKIKLILSGDYSNANTQISGSLKELPQKPESLFIQNISERTGKTNFPSLLGALHYQLDTNKNLNLQFEYFLNKRDFNNQYIFSTFKEKIIVSANDIQEYTPRQIPTFTGSLNYAIELPKGTWEMGLKYNSLNLTNDNLALRKVGNELFLDERTLLYKYNEQILAGFINKTLGIKKFNLEAGIRVEYSSVCSENTNFQKVTIPYDTSYVNIFPTISIQYTSEKEYIWGISYKNTIDRPDYSLLNPFKKYDGNISFFQGNTRIRPAFNNMFDVSLYKNNWYAVLGILLAKDFISTLYLPNPDGKQLIQIYSNFPQAQIYFGNIGYSATVAKIWDMQHSINFYLAKATFPTIESVASTPGLNISSAHTFDLGKSWRFDAAIDYSIAQSDGFFRHRQTSSIDLTIQKKIISPNLTFKLGIVDLFMSNKSGSEALYSNFLYKSVSYSDVFATRFTATWKFGKQSVKVKNFINSENKSEKKRLGQ